MNTIKAFFALAFAILLSVSGLYAQNKPEKKDSAQKVAYTCPMHPDVTSDKPGKCPKCGMALVEKKVYTCPMHPDVVADKPGKCPKCGMDLVEKKSPAHAKQKKDSTGMKMK